MATKKKTVKCSVPEGAEFNTSYSIPNDTMDTTIHNKYYWDYERNGRVDISDIFATSVDNVVKEIADLLKEKNKAYGNTALNPPQVFSKLNAIEALCARIDDKISRIKNKGINDETEDTVDDLIGYLILLKIAMNEK